MNQHLTENILELHKFKVGIWLFRYWRRANLMLKNLWKKKRDPFPMASQSAGQILQSETQRESLGNTCLVTCRMFPEPQDSVAVLQRRKPQISQHTVMPFRCYYGEVGKVFSILNPFILKSLCITRSAHSMKFHPDTIFEKIFFNVSTRWAYGEDNVW